VRLRSNRPSPVISSIDYVNDILEATHPSSTVVGRLTERWRKEAKSRSLIVHHTTAPNAHAPPTDYQIVVSIETLGMTHVPETGNINRLYFSGAGFWYVCHANPWPDLSGIRFRRRLEHCSIPSQKVACKWLEMIVYDRWLLAAGYCFLSLLIVSRTL